MESWWQHCTHCLAGGHEPCSCALGLVQDGFRWKRKWNHKKFFIGAMHSIRKRPCLMQVSVMICIKSFLKAINKSPHVHVQPTAVQDVIFHHAKELILWNRWITVHDVAPSSGKVLEVLKQLSTNLLLKKVCACWAPKILMFNQKVQYVALSVFLEQRVTCDETWVHYFTPQSKHSSME
jgi:hypothetical protein